MLHCLMMLMRMALIVALCRSSPGSSDWFSKIRSFGVFWLDENLSRKQKLACRTSRKFGYTIKQALVAMQAAHV